MAQISRAGAVNVEYSHFPVGELWEAGFERREGKPDFQAEEPVVVVPGQIVVTSRVQEHSAPVVLVVSDRADEAPGPAWVLVTSVAYQPIYTGRMAAFDTMNGPAGGAVAPIEVFGRQAEPGEPLVDLDPARTYRVQVWAQGRADARERFDSAVQREERDSFDVFESYVIVFVPSGTQEPPQPAPVESRRDRLARQHGKPPLNMR
ncbi:hypothetical protein AB0D27_08915 [Streptomyces sp. NPDC048415]|jgi:hypothetical protein|uniref:hypothetical protein n=1 Tax=Streptomyces sp. NPDC048415 TaxID=3154822 RepID=UPI00341A8F1B